MIFSVYGSIEKIKNRTKTQTRRPTDRYEVGKTYAIQPKRTAKGIPDGRVKILRKITERSNIFFTISTYDAFKEGGYTPEEFESLYEKMYPKWTTRYAYKFEYVEGGQ